MSRRAWLVSAVLAGCSGAPPPVPSGPSPSASESTASAAAVDPRCVSRAAAAAPPACEGRAGAPAPAAAARQVLDGHHTAQLTTLSIARGRVVSTSEDGSVRVWDLATHHLLRTLRGGELAGPRAAAFTDDPSLLAVAARQRKALVTLDGVVKEERGDLVFPQMAGSRGAARAFRHYAEKVTDLTLPGHATLKLADADGAIGSWGDGFAVAPDGSAVIAGTSGGLRTWRAGDASGDAPIVPRDLPLPGRPRLVAVTGDGTTVLAAVDVGPGPFTRDLLAVPLDGTAPRKLLAAEEYLEDVIASADGRTAAAVAYGRVVVFDLPSGHERWQHEAARVDVKKRETSLDRQYGRVALSDDARALVVATLDGSMLAFDAGTGRYQGDFGAKLRVPAGDVWVDETTLAVSSPGHVSLFSTRDGGVTAGHDVDGTNALWLAANGDLVLAHGEDAVSYIGDCPDDALAVMVTGFAGTSPPPAPDADGEADDADAPDPPVTWPPHGVRSMPACVPEARAMPYFDPLRGVAVVTNERQAAGVDLRTAKRTVLAGWAPDDLVFGVVLQGRWVGATAGGALPMGRHGVLWDAATGKLAQEITLEEDFGTTRVSGIELFTLADDGHAVGAFAGHVALRDLASDAWLWDVDVREVVTTLAVVQAPGDLLVGTERGNVFHVRDGVIVARVERPAGGAVRALAISPERTRVAVRHDDGAISLVALEPLVIGASLAEFDDDEFVAFTPGGAYAGTREVARRVGWVFDDPLERFSFEQFAGNFRDPALVTRRLAGGLDDAMAAVARPPRLEILASPPPDTAIAHAPLRVHVTSGSRVDTLRAFVEGRPVASRAVCAASADVDIDIPLDAGHSRVALVAFDAAGRSSNATLLDLRGLDAASTRPTLWVLAVGVSRYPLLAADAQLELADADARALAERLQAEAGPGRPYGEARVKLLVNEAVTPDSVLDALGELCTMQPQDTAVVFFAGHGVRLGEGADAPMVFLGSTADATPSGAAQAGIGWEAIGARLAGARGRVLMLLDACHAGALTADFGLPNDALASALVDEQRAGVVVFAASKGRQPSYEPIGPRALRLGSEAHALVAPRPPVGDAPGATEHGLFTGALLASLSSAATDRDGDGAIELSELVDDVTERVTVASRTAQTPWLVRRELFGDFALAKAPE